jgi:uncharacterized membrane protein YccC
LTEAGKADAGNAGADPAAAPIPPGVLGGFRTLVAVDLRQVSVAEGLRAALSTAVIVALNEFLHWPPITEAALAALLTCLCDPGGPIGRRLPAILTFGVLGSLVTVGYGVLRNAPLAVVIPLACAGIFCSAFARINGQAAQQVGNLLTVVQVLALTRTITDWREGAELGGMFLCGSLWAGLLTLVIWRVYPYLPARRAVADVYRQLARLTGDLRLVLQHDSPHETIWDQHARQHRRGVRDALERARTAVLATVRARGPFSGRAAQSWLRLETADQIFAALVGLSELLAWDHDPADRATADRILRLLRPQLVVLAHYIVTDRPERLPRLDRATASIAAAAAPGSRLHHAANLLAERLKVAITLSAPEGWQAGTPVDEPAHAAWQRLRASIAGNLSWQSDAFRHALRAAATAAPAFAITLHWPTQYGHWLTIMLVMTMQPYVALTYARAAERVAGTMIGSLIAALLAIICTTPLSIAFALFPLAVIALSVRPASFGLFITCITPLIVLLSELGRPGESELTIAGMRAVYALIGGGLAVVATLVLWPSWEPNRVARDLRAAILTHGAYAKAEIAALLGEASEAIVDAARRAAGMTSNNLEATLQRALLEPGGNVETLTATLTIDAALRRMAGRITALQLAETAGHDPAPWRAWSDWIDAATTHLAQREPDLPPRPALPAGDPQAESLSRIARQLEVSAGAVRRLG